MRRPLVLGNWKMHGTLAQARQWAGAARAMAESQPQVEVGVVPAHVHLPACLELAAGSALRVGAQDLSAHGAGAYTGEVSAPMLADLGAQVVLVGHSERRQYHGEDDELVARKVAIALAHGLLPVLCVGESLEEREAGLSGEMVLRQFEAVAAHIGSEGLRGIALAYEPVWAIGTGRTASPEQAQEVHALLRSALGRHDAMLRGLVRILYGGSVKGSNASQLLAQADIDGALVGGASLVPEEFAAICRAAGEAAAQAGA